MKWSINTEPHSDASYWGVTLVNNAGGHEEEVQTANIMVPQYVSIKGKQDALYLRKAMHFSNDKK